MNLLRLASPFRCFLLAIILLAVAGLSGCVSLDEARSIALAAEARLDQAEAAAAAATELVAQARALAEATDSEAAIRAVTQAESALAAAREALPAARAAAATAAESLAAASAARQAGWGFADWALAIAGAAIPAAAGIAAAIKARRWADLAGHGLQLAQSLKKRAESAQVPVDDILKPATAWQEAKKVHGTVERLRRA